MNCLIPVVFSESTVVNRNFASLHDLAVLYKELFNYEMSYKYANIALNEYKKLNNKEGIADANSFIGDYYFHINDTVNVFRNVH